MNEPITVQVRDETESSITTLDPVLEAIIFALVALISMGLTVGVIAYLQHHELKLGSIFNRTVIVEEVEPIPEPETPYGTEINPFEGFDYDFPFSGDSDWFWYSPFDFYEQTPNELEESPNEVNGRTSL